MIRKKSFPSARYVALLFLGSIPAVALFLWRSQTTNGLGFPLDDAWIHQTYARNLMTRAEWAFIPGVPSSGSTAPLWTVLVSLGYMLPIPQTTFSFLLGWLALLAIVYLLASHLYKHREVKRIVIASLLVMMLYEWHLLWAALSGMETLLLGVHILLVLRGLEHSWNPVVLGALVGVGIWIRPDAILALIPVFWVVVFKPKPMNERVRQAVGHLTGLAMLTLPYVLFNFNLGGEWWPSTFYAKQLEYAVTRELSLLARLGKMGLAPLIGPAVLLIPGIVIGAVRYLRSRNWAEMAGLTWVAAFICVYALRLPVDYQHGRYMMPLIPVLFLLGYDGLLWAMRGQQLTFGGRVMVPVWIISLIIVTLVFWGRGAKAYATDVAIIESEMVTAAKWIASNTEQDALIAAHDIGALGFYGKRQILDLAGLISPEVIPIIRDEQGLEAFLVIRQADYLMTFPGWYPQLTQDREQVYSTAGSFSPSVGGENMAVYLWR